MKIRFTIIIILFINYNLFAGQLKIVQRDTALHKASNKAEELFLSSKNEGLVEFCHTQIRQLKKQDPVDSLEIALLYQFQCKAHYKLMHYLESIKSSDAGIKYCNDSEEGRQLKGELYSDKASAENYTGKKRSVFNSTLNAIKFLRSTKEPNYDYLVTSYRFLSEQCAYLGNDDDAKMYLRQAKRLYEQNREKIDSTAKNPDGSVVRYDIILLYSRVYQLYKYGETKKDSLEIVDCINKFEDFNDSPEFSIKNEGIYYSTALNHVGDWYASRKPESQTTSKDIEKALYYIDKSINLVENKGYPGILLSTKYNKVKALALANRLQEAETLMNELLEPLSENDGRRPYFLAQKGLIKAKEKQKDSSVRLFYDALSKVHSDTTTLSKSLDNFKPSTSFGHTKLLLRISEELKRFFPKDSSVNRMVSKLYPMAFFQFENSYEKRKFNKTYDDYLRQIIKGIIESKTFGYNENLTPTYILNRVENIQHLLAWQKFNTNRQINDYPELDSLQLRNYELRSLIADAKSQNNIYIADSLNVHLSQTQKFTRETFPNLNLFNTESFEVKALQEKLKENQIVLKYLVLENEIVVFTVTTDRVKVILKPWSKKDSKDIEKFIESLTAKNYETVLSEKISNQILPQLDKTINQIIISPDESLSKLPFEVLKFKNEFLVDQYNISYTSHLGFIAPELISTKRKDELAIYAPEYPQSKDRLAVRSKPAFLEGAQKESELISQLFPSKLFKGKQLTKQDFIKTASNYKLLHLAMHAQIDNDQSGLSRLIFRDGDSDKDDLYLEELYGLNLSADLAVLSACNTGVGKSKSKSEIESFQRAFTFAGVPSTVASLWEVPDKPTKEIMLSFYKNLKKGQKKSLALKNAKIKFKNKNKGSKLEQPYYWAGFVLYGTDQPIVTENNSNLWIYLTILIFGSLIFLYFYKNSSRT